jgi:hypothetical protein
MPQQLRERLAAQAKLNSHSLHAEIIGILQGAVDGGQAHNGALDIDALAEALAPKLAARLKTESR